MTQGEFNALMEAYLAAHLGEGYYTSKYGGEEIDALLDKIPALEAALTALQARVSALEGGAPA